MMSNRSQNPRQSVPTTDDYPEHPSCCTSPHHLTDCASERCSSTLPDARGFRYALLYAETDITYCDIQEKLICAVARLCDSY
jgi:hypothetical protein